MTDGRGDFFERARLLATGMLLLGALLLMAGPALAWVSIEPPEVVPASELPHTRSFSGFEADTGWVALVAGIAVAGNSLFLLRLRRSSFAWLAMLAAVVAGGVTMADYRGLPDINSALAERMEVVGRLSPGAGMVLCAVGAVLTLVGGAAGAAASPGSRTG